jgi:hypothetical protein
MPFSPRQIVVHWVPGFTLLAMIFLIDRQNGGAIARSVEGLHLNASIAVLVMAGGGFVVGNFLDVLRDIGEEIWDHLPGCKIEWNFLLEADASKVQRLEDYHFTYYVLSANLTSAFIITMITDWWYPNHFPCWGWGLISVATITFGIDAKRIRGDIVEQSHKLLKEARQKKPNETTPSS